MDNRHKILFYFGIILISPALFSLLFSWWITPTSFYIESHEAFTEPCFEFIMGTDDLGRDLFTGIVQGLRNSLLVGIGVTFIAYSIGIILGMLSGYFRGSVDYLLMKLSEIFMVMPHFLIVILSAAFLGQGVINLILTLGLFSWEHIYRIVRSEVLSLRTREYIVAATSLGAGFRWITYKHFFPMIMPTVSSVMPLTICYAIMAEAGLSFLGLGDPDQVSLGYLISNSNQFLFSGWWLFVFPGLFLTLTIAGFTLINFSRDGLYMMLSPRPEREAKVQESDQVLLY